MGTRRINLGNLMVSAVNGESSLFAIDTTAVLGAFNPSEILSYGSGSRSMMGVFSAKKELQQGPGGLLDAVFKMIIQTVRSGTKVMGSHRGPVPPSPADVLETTFNGQRSKLLSSFESGWDDALVRIYALVSSSEGRQQMRGVMGAFKEGEGAGDLRKTTLKTNALYLGAMAGGKNHDEAVVAPQVYNARKWIQELNPVDLVLPGDEFHWNQASVPRSALSAGLDDLPSLPGPTNYARVYGGGGTRYYNYDKAKFDAMATSIRSAKAEAENIGTKKRLFRGDVARNRTVAGRFLAEAAAVSIGGIRAGGTAGRGGHLLQQLQLVLTGPVTPNQAADLLRKLKVTQSNAGPLRAQSRQFISTLNDAAAGVAAIKAYKWGADVAAAMRNVVEFLQEVDEKNRLAFQTANPNLLERLLERAAAAPGK
jgi:hypothetical protein